LGRILQADQSARAEGAESSPRVRSHGSFFDPQRVGHFVIGQTDEVAEHHDLTLATRQPTQRRRQGEAERDAVLDVVLGTLKPTTEWACA
jgi:hypothetical protein